MPLNDAKRPPRVSYENGITLLTLAAGLPAVVTLLLILWTSDETPAKLDWTITLLVISCWLGFAISVRSRVVRPLQTSSNLLAALREGDFSVRARSSAHGDALDGIFTEVNELSETLREQRLGAMEATNLLRTVMSEVDVVVFTFDDEQRLRLVNRAGERLLNQPTERLLGRTATELGLARCLVGPVHEPLPMEFPGGAGRWGIRVSSIREHGKPHQVLLMSDLTRPLRAEEVQAWKRLVRVLGHELNNSLTPIKSIASSLKTLVDREPLPGDWRQDVDDGLRVISGRAEALARFMSSYARLARLPEPKPGTVEVDQWVRRIAELETRMKVLLTPGPPLTIQGDGDQLDQLLINLIRNAADAALETGEECERAGGALIRSSKCGSKMKAQAWQIPLIYSYPSSQQSREDQESGWR